MTPPVILWCLLVVSNLIAICVALKFWNQIEEEKGLAEYFEFQAEYWENEARQWEQLYRQTKRDMIDGDWWKNQ